MRCSRSLPSSGAVTASATCSRRSTKAFSTGSRSISRTCRARTTTGGWTSFARSEREPDERLSLRVVAHERRIAVAGESFRAAVGVGFAGERAAHYSVHGSRAALRSDHACVRIAFANLLGERLGVLAALERANLHRVLRTGGGLRRSRRFCAGDFRGLGCGRRGGGSGG